MLICQAWLAHRRVFSAHRMIGRTSFLLMPLFLSGGLLVLKTMAVGAGPDGNPLMQVYGARLGIFDALALTGFAALYAAAIANRRHVQLHARYMLATALLLLAPVLTRAGPALVPALRPQSLDDLPMFGQIVQGSNFVVLAVALALAFASGRYGRPYTAVALLTAMQIVAFQWLGGLPWWRESYLGLARLSDGVLIASGLACGGLVIGLAFASAWFTPGGSAGSPGKSAA